MVDFTIGVVIGLAFVSGREATWPVRASTLEAFIVALTCLAIVLSPLAPSSLRFSALLMPFCGSTVFVFAHQRGAISQALSHPVLVRFGEVSFAFYLMHLTIIVVISHVLGGRNAASLPVMLSITLAVSFALFHWVETPMRRHVRGLALPRVGTVGRGSHEGMRKYADGTRFGVCKTLQRPYVINCVSAVIEAGPGAGNRIVPTLAED